MNSWLRLIFGLEEGEVPVGGESSWELSSLPSGTWLVAAAAIVLAALVLIVLLYVRERSLSPLRRAVLTALRLVALALVVLILLNPRLLTEIHLEHRGRTLLLFDRSASMAQRDEYEPERRDRVERATGLETGASGPTRAELAVAAIERADLITSLEAKNRVRAFGFAEGLAEVSGLDGLRSLVANGTETRLGEAIAGALEAVADAPLAGVIVVTDGRANAGASAFEVVRGLALERRVPVHAIGVGRSELPPNLAIDEIIAPPVAQVGYPIELEALVRIAGLRGPATVTLYRDEGEGTTRVRIAEQEIVADSTEFETRVRFVDSLSKKGRYRYLVRLPKRRGEVEWRDNSRTATVTAAEEHRRVLLVAGVANNEYKFVRNFCLRDSAVQVSCWLSSIDRRMQQDGDVVLRELPETDEALREFDAVVLIDPDPESLTAGFLDALVRFVNDDGGGLAYVASDVHAPALVSNAAMRPLVSLLPVDLDSARADRAGTIHDEAWRPEPTARGSEHPLLRLDDVPEISRGLWRTLPGFYYAFPARELRAAAIGLARSPSSVLIALQRVGRGEVLYLGSDDFWRWRATEIAHHERFWAGIVRYLSLGKFQAGTGKVTIESDRDRYRVGEDVRLTAHLVDGKRQPVEKPNVDVSIEGRGAATDLDPETDSNARDGGTRDGSGTSASSGGAADARTVRRSLSLAPVVGEPGRYSGVFKATEAGEYEVRIDPETVGFFRVTAPSTELEDPSPDLESLERLARESGGLFVGLDRVGELPELIPETRIREILGRRATTLWDSWAMILLFCGLLVTEWSLRKLWRLS